MRPAADALAVALERLSALAGVEAWLENFPSPQGFQRPKLSLAALANRAGDPFLADEALAALRALADPPVPRPVARLHQPVDQRVKEGAA
jgi:hypothetical protein